MPNNTYRVASIEGTPGKQYNTTANVSQHKIYRQPEDEDKLEDEMDDTSISIVQDQENLCEQSLNVEDCTESTTYTPTLQCQRPLYLNDYVDIDSLK